MTDGEVGLRGWVVTRWIWVRQVGGFAGLVWWVEWCVERRLVMGWVLVWRVGWVEEGWRARCASRMHGAH